MMSLHIKQQTIPGTVT